MKKIIALATVLSQKVTSVLLEHSDQAGKFIKALGKQMKDAGLPVRNTGSNMFVLFEAGVERKAIADVLKKLGWAPNAKLGNLLGADSMRTLYMKGNDWLVFLQSEDGDVWELMFVSPSYVSNKSLVEGLSKIKGVSRVRAQGDDSESEAMFEITVADKDLDVDGFKALAQNIAHAVNPKLKLGKVKKTREGYEVEADMSSLSLNLVYFPDNAKIHMTI